MSDVKRINGYDLKDDKARKLLGEYVTPEMYNAVGDGVTDDSEAIQSAIDYANEHNLNIYLGKNKTYYIETPLEINNKCIFYGNSTLKGKSGNTSIISINNDDVTIDGLTFNSNDVTYSIYINSNNSVVKNCNFKGKVGNYIRVVNVKNIDILDNVLDCKDYTQITPIVFWRANKFKCLNNRIYDHSGFGIQTVYSSDGLLSNNIIDNTTDESEITVTESTNTFTFTLTRNNNERYSVYVNDILTSATVTNNHDNTYSVLLANNLDIDDVIKIIAYKSLENFNINSQSYNLEITNNTMNVTGDSNIVIGADYHDGVIDLAHVTNDDRPENINISNNIISNAKFSGINNEFRKKLICSNNIIVNASMGSDNVAFNCGIKGGSLTDSIISNNIIEKTDSLSNIKEGIAVNNQVDQDVEYSKYLTLSNNKVINIDKVYEFFSGTTTTGKRGIIIDTPVRDYYEQIDTNTSFTNKPSDSSNGSIVYAHSGAGVVYDTTNVEGQIGSIKTISGSSNYLDINLKGRSAIQDSIVNFKFLAKATSENDSCYIQFINIVSSVTTTTTYKIKPSNTNWETFTCQAISNKISNGNIPAFIIRILGDTGNVSIQNPIINYQNIN